MESGSPPEKLFIPVVTVFCSGRCDGVEKRQHGVGQRPDVFSDGGLDRQMSQVGLPAIVSTFHLSCPTVAVVQCCQHLKSPIRELDLDSKEHACKPFEDELRVLHSLTVHFILYCWIITLSSHASAKSIFL